MANSFHFDISNVVNGLVSCSDKMMQGLDLYGQTVAMKMASYAKANKPWIDRTAHAKQSISGKSWRTGTTLIIQISGGMEYSPYLEFAMDKKYAVLFPTLLKNKTAILEGIKYIMG